MPGQQPGNQNWRTLGPDALAKAYSPSSCLDGDIGRFIAGYVDRSNAARQQCRDSGQPIHEIRYGRGSSQTIDLVVPEAATSEAAVRDAARPLPLVVFIHGGYWQELSKIESFFAAQDCLEAGFAFAAVDYTLAPEATLDEIVTECRTSLAALVTTASEHDIDPARIVVTGSSAGAHLAAMVGIGPDWRPAATVLVSGVFDLEPLIDTYINDAVGLDLSGAHRNSPALAELASFPPTVIAYGDNETAEFKRQSNEFASLLRTAGTEVTTIEVPGRNHFDVILDLCDPATALGSHTLAFCA